MKSKPKFEKGDEVEWPWGRGIASGKVTDIYLESVTREIKGKKITRHGTPEKPAYLITQANGGEVLKSETEIHKLERKHGWA